MRTKQSVCLAMLLLLTTSVLAGPDTEQARMLEVRRKQVALQSVRSDLVRRQEMFDEGLISKAELDAAKTRLTGAELDYQEAVLAVLSLEPRVSVRRALKIQAPDGRRLVQLTLVNLTSAFDDSQFKLMSNFEGAAPLPAGLKTRALRDLFVSLRDSGSADAAGRTAGRGVTIALPYEVYVPELPYGTERTLEFQLLRDVDSVLVTIAQKGGAQEIDLQLEQAGTGGIVQVTSTQLSQEADLGGQATYDLRLERSTVDVRSLKLEVTQLPPQVSYSFFDPQGDARLSQINFGAGVRQQNLKLRLFLPERSDEAVKIDTALPFFVVAAGNGKEEAGTLRLEVIPRGVGKIEVAAESLFAETDPGKDIEATFRLRNSGTRRLDNIQVSAEAPLNWRVELLPQTIPALDTHREQAVRLRIVPPADAPVGDYELRIRTQSYAYNRQVPTEDKIFRVSVKAKTKIWIAGSVLGGLLLVAGGILVTGVRMARR